MKTKVFILGLIFFALIACDKKIENPYSPEPPESPQAKLEFMEDPTLYCPSYDALLGSQEVRLDYRVTNTGNAIYGLSYFYIDVRLYNKNPFALLFADVFLINIPAGEIVMGGLQTGTLLFDLETNIWDKYVSEEAYKEVKIISGNQCSDN